MGFLRTLFLWVLCVLRDFCAVLLLMWGRSWRRGVTEDVAQDLLSPLSDLMSQNPDVHRNASRPVDPLLSSHGSLCPRAAGGVVMLGSMHVVSRAFSEMTRVCLVAGQAAAILIPEHRPALCQGCRDQHGVRASQAAASDTSIPFGCGFGSQLFHFQSSSLLMCRKAEDGPGGLNALVRVRGALHTPMAFKM